MADKETVQQWQKRTGLRYPLHWKVSANHSMFNKAYTTIEYGTLLQLFGLDKYNDKLTVYVVEHKSKVEIYGR